MHIELFYRMTVICYIIGKRAVLTHVVCLVKINVKCQSILKITHHLIKNTHKQWDVHDVPTNIMRMADGMGYTFLSISCNRFHID